MAAWQQGIDLVEMVYRVTQTWPREEAYGLVGQTRRAAVSVPANVAEGQGRRGAREFLHHVSVAYGSLCELETHLVIARRVGYVDEATHRTLTERSTHVARLLSGLMKHLESQVSR